MVSETDVVRLVTTMATTMSLRSGKRVRFEITGDGSVDGVMPTPDGRGLRGVLQELSQPQDAVAI